jgi:periplasmic copper chaperone A
MKRRLFLAFALWPTLARAHSFKLGAISIGHAWAIQTPPNAKSNELETSVMFPLLNAGSKPDALTTATCAIAKKVELRNSSASVDQFILEPNKPFPMRVVGNHIQLIGLTKTLLADEIVEVTLNFKNAGSIKISAYVNEKPGN